MDPQVSKPGTTFEALADSEGLTSLDAELAAGLLQMAKGPIAKRFQILADRAAVADTFLRGRQLLHVIYEHYKIVENQGMGVNCLLYQIDASDEPTRFNTSCWGALREQK